MEEQESTMSFNRKSHTLIVDKGKDATCTEKGLTEGSHCSVCNAIIKYQEEIPMISHTYGEPHNISAPTCVSKGLEYRLCTECNFRKENEIDYDYSKHQNVSVTFDIEFGKEVTTGHWICNDCGRTGTILVNDITTSGTKGLSFDY